MLSRGILAVETIAHMRHHQLEELPENGTHYTPQNVSVLIIIGSPKRYPLIWETAYQP